MTPPPDALLFLTPSCPHCPQVLQALGDLLKAGVLGRLEAVNLEVHPEAAIEAGVRSVPWVRIGPFELTGARSRQELAAWAARVGTPQAMADYFHVLLKEAGLARVLALVEAQPALLADLLPIVANAEASMNVRLGASAVFERRAGSPELKALVPRLGELAGHADARVRADACHYLGLSAAPQAMAFLRPRLADDDADVRDIAADSLEALAPDTPNDNPKET